MTAAVAVTFTPGDGASSGTAFVLQGGGHAILYDGSGNPLGSNAVTIEAGVIAFNTTPGTVQVRYPNASGSGHSKRSITVSPPPTGGSGLPSSVIAEINAAVAAVVAAAPEYLDTLKELADAIGDDPNYATTMVNALAAKEPAGLSSATLTMLGLLFNFQDGGSTVQWIASTPVAKGAVVSYNGVIYVRAIDGTGPNVDASFIRSHWVALGADPAVIGGGELAATSLASTWSQAVGASVWTDVTAWNAAPIIPSSGRGVYCDFSVGVTSSVANNAISVRLWDIAAGAVAKDSQGNTLGGFGTTCVTANTGFPVSGFWRPSAAAGVNAYKIQIAPHLAATVTVLARDFGFEAPLRFVAK